MCGKDDDEGWEGGGGFKIKFQLLPKGGFMCLCALFVKHIWQHVPERLRMLLDILGRGEGWMGGGWGDVFKDSRIASYGQVCGAERTKRIQGN